MKESEFIELLNLYLDHEISAADAVRLEAEVQSNPARRRVYQQYCRMQKACKMVAADFQTDTESETAASRKVVAFDAAASVQRKRAGSLYTLGTFAAVAACVAIVFVGQSRQRANSEVMAVVAQPAPQGTPSASTVEATANVSVANVPAPRGLVSIAKRSQSMLVSAPLLLTGSTRTDAMMTSAADDASGQLAWIESVQLAPLQQRVSAEVLRFDVRPATLRPEARVLGSNRASTETATEMAAFRFVK